MIRTAPTVGTSTALGAGVFTTKVWSSGADTSIELVPHLQEILHRWVERRIERNLKAEEHVLRRHRMAVGKLGPFAQMERPSDAIRRHFPRLCQRRLDLLRVVVVADQTRKTSAR